MLDTLAKTLRQATRDPRARRYFLPIPATCTLPLGTEAPDFDLPVAKAGSLRLHLADYRGRQPVLLAFTRIFTESLYCPLCYPHILALNAAYDRFAARDIAVLLIATTDMEQSCQVAADLNLKIPLLSDPEGMVFRRYGLGQALGAPLPGQFAIDKAGRLIYRHLFSFLDPNADCDPLLDLDWAGAAAA